ncbi:BaiN/RdsA family NAD(P)/FAD-dependent oxidoreductase [Aminithiophilus ramosus]|uniref:NAD(P)/FAD-dependent oxidoreductase n=1 Tax=Aminithiophilus ramosus TaxID=3029084 RepID=UPI00236816E6|nr:NAD(P)/FAD-dependent oxidoreductase [Aminithiophilus ramosus]
MGGGPAGLFAAAEAAAGGERTLLVEGNGETGKKLLLTGKGRCNFTNAGLSAQTLQEPFGRKGRFLHTGLAAFGPEAICRFFDERGLASVVERGKRVFPASGDARTVRDLLVEEARRQGVTIRTNHLVRELLREDRRIVAVRTSKGELRARRIIVATGGCSYGRTGSRGDAFGWARELGIDVVPPRPAIVPIRTAESGALNLDGLILRNVALALFVGGKKTDSRFGEMQFTPFGISGPIAMDLARNVGEALEGNDDVTLSIDLKPALDAAKIDARLIRDIEKRKGYPFSSLLAGLLPRELIASFVDLAAVAVDRPLNGITKEERQRIAALLKGFPLTPTGLLGFDWALVTSGGISLKELDPRTMRAKAWENLHFAGEVIDLDGPTGGYNLQVCWSTAFLAGRGGTR